MILVICVRQTPLTAIVCQALRERLDEVSMIQHFLSALWQDGTEESRYDCASQNT